MRSESKKFQISPTWDQIEAIRMESINYFQSHGFSDESIHSLSMIISELMENGVKYGFYEKSEQSVVVVINLKRDTVTIEVFNPVSKKTYRHLSRLDKTIQWIRGYQDPFEAYIERLKEVAKKPIHDRESGIGLVRIAYEGKALLDFFVDDKNMLNVSAVSNLEK